MGTHNIHSKCGNIQVGRGMMLINCLRVHNIATLIGSISNPKRKLYVAVVYSRGKYGLKGNLRVQTNFSSSGGAETKTL